MSHRRCDFLAGCLALARVMLGDVFLGPYTVMQRIQLFFCYLLLIEVCVLTILSLKVCLLSFYRYLPLRQIASPYVVHGSCCQ